MLDRITIIDDICNGKNYQSIFLAGDSGKKTLESYPFLEKEDLDAVEILQ